MVQWLVEWITYLFPIVFVIFVVYALIYRKRAMKKHTEIVDKSLAYSKETVDLLKEIRDLLKR